MDTEKCQQLWEAATEGNLPLVQQLCQDPSVNLNWQDNEYLRSPFYRACGHGWTEIVRFMLGFQDLGVNLPSKEELTPFCIANQEGHAEIVSLLLADERVEINRPKSDGATPFLMACLKGHVATVSVLLADERVDVNQAKKDEATPFLMACHNGHVGTVSLLLADQRVDINRPWETAATPLWAASNQGYLVVIQHLLVSGREIDTKKISTFDNTTAAARARSLASRVMKFDWESEKDFQRKKANGPMIAELIESFERNPRQVRAELRLELNEPLAGELFALVVYLSDGYLEIPRRQTEFQNEKSMKAQKFFNLVLQLPMDLQMVLCNRVFGLEDSIIKRVHSEEGFRKFANQGF